VATFDPKFAHDILLPIAEAAYLPKVQANDLPANFSVVGPIVVDQTRFAALMAAAPLQHAQVVAKMRASGDGFGWVIQNPQAKVVVVSFRGTVSPEDWLDDFDFLATPYAPLPNFGLVHQGFQLAYMAVRDSLLRQLANAAKGFSRLIVTGHSLGAALSELAAPDLLHNAGLGLLPEVQNFAGPRVGFHDFASIFDVQIDVCFRVVNLWDIVPRVPPPLALFEHVGLAVHVDGGFTLDELVAHSMEKSYGPGLERLIPQAAAQLKAPSFSAVNFRNEMLIGREP
jgi:triacylglycerol lipase